MLTPKQRIQQRLNPLMSGAVPSRLDVGVDENPEISYPESIGQQPIDESIEQPTGQSITDKVERGEPNPSAELDSFAQNKLAAQDAAQAHGEGIEKSNVDLENLANQDSQASQDLQDSQSNAGIMDSILSGLQTVSGADMSGVKAGINKGVKSNETALSAEQEKRKGLKESIIARRDSANIKGKMLNEQANTQNTLNAADHNQLKQKAFNPLIEKEASLKSEEIDADRNTLTGKTDATNIKNAEVVSFGEKGNETALSMAVKAQAFITKSGLSSSDKLKMKNAIGDGRTKSANEIKDLMSGLPADDALKWAELSNKKLIAGNKNIKDSQLSEAQTKQVGALDKSIARLDDIDKSFQADFPGGVLNAKAEQFLKIFSANDPKYVEFRTKLASNFNEMLKEMSGASVTAAEQIRAQNAIPNLNDTPEELLIKIETFNRLVRLDKDTMLTSISTYQPSKSGLIQKIQGNKTPNQPSTQQQTKPVRQIGEKKVIGNDTWIWNGNAWETKEVSK